MNYKIKHPRFLIVATGYNCAKYVWPCLSSVKAQTYINYHFVIVSDHSTDNTADEIISFLDHEANYESCREWRPMCLYGTNNMGTVAARKMVIDAARRSDLAYDAIVWLDLDDELLPHALEVVAEKYRNGAWLTYGNYCTQDGTVPLTADDLDFPRSIHERNEYRKAPFIFTHLRTFRKELWYALTEEDFDTRGAKSYPDAHVLWSMMEMCGPDRMIPISNVLYKYNTDNPLAVMKRWDFNTRQTELAFARARTPKQRLTHL